MIILVELEAIRFGDRIGGENRIGCSVSDDLPVQENGPVEMNRQHSHIVGTDDNGPVFLGGDFLQGVEDEFLGFDVDMVQRFVQKEEVRVMGQGTGQHGPLLLSSGQLADLTPGRGRKFPWSPSPIRQLRGQLSSAFLDQPRWTYRPIMTT